LTRFQIARGSKATLRFSLAFAGLLLALPMGIALFGLPHGAVTFHASSDGLRIEGDPYGRLIKNDQLKISEARLLDLDAEPNYTPTLRTNGIGLPGYQSGWFETRGAGPALLFLADRTRAVLIPTTLGYSLIISPESPQILIDDLKKQFGVAQVQPLATGEPDGAGIPPGVWMIWLALLAVPVPVAILMLALAVLSRRVVFELNPGALRIRGSLFGRTIPLDRLKVAEARLVDLAHGPDRPRLIRTLGVGLPGYLAGWCRGLRGEGRFLAFLTDKARAVRIPTADGYTLFLSPAAPELFLQALNSAL
jgi:hypothetical protein